MYLLSRFLLLLGLLQIGLVVAIIVLQLLPWSLFLVAIMAGKARMPIKEYWTHGTARWATERELRRAGMIGSRKGLSIGRLCEDKPPSRISSIALAIDPRFGAKEATTRCLSRLTRWNKPREGEIVRLSNSVHTTIFGPTGAGKGVSFIKPFLLDTNESAFVLDIKGEAARLTARHREKVFGHRVVLLDPFQLVTQSPDSLNPLDLIPKDSRFAIDDCRDLAEQLVVKTGMEREPHWNAAAEMWIAAALIGVVQHVDGEDRSLQMVREVLSSPDRLAGLLQHLQSSDRFISRMGKQLGHFKDKELSSTLTTVNRHLCFLDTPAIAASTATSSFDINDLQKGKMTVFCIIPPHHLRAQTALIRMWIGTTLRSMARGGLAHA